MSELLAVIVVVLGAAPLLLGLGTRGFGTTERRWVVLSYALHIAAGAIHLLVTQRYYGGGDLLYYLMCGELIGDLMHQDFGMAQDAWALVVQDVPRRLPFTVLGSGTSTGTMTGISSFLHYALAGSSYAVCIAMSLISMAGKLALYRVFRARLPVDLHRIGLFSCLFVPSVVYWCAGLMKESVAFAGIGGVLLGMHHLADRRLIRAAIILSLGVLPLFLVRQWVLYGLFVSGVVWFYLMRASRQGRQVRLGRILAGVSLAIITMFGIGSILPAFAVDNWVEETARLQYVGQIISGSGSSYQLLAGDRGLAGQILTLPWAVFTTLYRPLIVEVRGATVLVAALETTAFLIFSIRLLVRARPRVLWRELRGSPELMFCTTFVLLLAGPIGLATTNFGTLARYRSPVLPFFVLVLLVLSRRCLRVQVTAPAKKLHLVGAPE